jgi:hypothetical protein
MAVIMHCPEYLLKVVDATNAFKSPWLISLAGKETPAADEPFSIELHSIEIRQRQRQ